MPGWLKLVAGMVIGAVVFAAIGLGVMMYLAAEDEDAAEPAGPIATVLPPEEPVQVQPVQAGPPSVIPAVPQVPLPPMPQLPGVGGQVMPPATPSVPPAPPQQSSGSVEVAQAVPDAGIVYPPAVVLPTATDIDLAASYAYDPADPYCNRPALLTDTFQEIAFGMARELHDGLAFSMEEEIALGNEMYLDLTTAGDSPFVGRVDTNPYLTAYVTQVAAPIVALVERQGIPYTFHVVDDPEINAFATPGGHIYVLTGLLMDRPRVQNEAQLAGILAHEIGHVDMGHTTAAYEVLAGIGVAGTEADIPMSAILRLMETPYSAEYEDESDRYALDRLFRTQYSPFQFEVGWRNWDRLDGGADTLFPTQPANPNDPIGSILGQVGRELDNVLGTHSPHSQRACNARVEIQRLIASCPYDRFYVGTANLGAFVARGTQQF